MIDNSSNIDLQCLVARMIRVEEKKMAQQLGDELAVKTWLYFAQCRNKHCSIMTYN